MIKHGKIHPLQQRGRPNSHIEPIKEFVTKGIADAKEKITLQPMACDVKGAKRFNGQQCVIARAFKRTYKPQAVAVGRSLAYAVFNGLAIRFSLPPKSRELVEEFDQKGRARNAPIELVPASPTWQIGRTAPSGKNDGSRPKKHRTRKIGVRAVGGGIAA